MWTGIQRHRNRHNAVRVRLFKAIRGVTAANMREVANVGLRIFVASPWTVMPNGNDTSAGPIGFRPFKLLQES